MPPDVSYLITRRLFDQARRKRWEFSRGEHGLFRNHGRFHLIHRPSSAPSLDIIFVHGLGGDVVRSWCKDGHRELFWPEKWLPLDPELKEARIFGYDYEAHFNPPHIGQSVQEDVKHFAGALLDEMRFKNDLNGEPFDLGNAPIVFVGFDIGGLVIKQAHILALSDNRYREMARSFGGVIFLATPHRITNFPGVETLLRRAEHSMRDMGLLARSTAAEGINIQFQHVASNLSMWSFFETLETDILDPPTLLIDRASSLLGYPGEIEVALEADHNNVCKFSSPDDASYLKVLGGLKAIVKDVLQAPPGLYTPLSFQKVEVRASHAGRFTKKSNKPQIRLISIDQSDDDSAPLSCSLKQMPLFQAPPFTALSYCWGDMAIRVPIRVNQKNMAVTSNLHAALTRLRSDRVEAVWIDALCLSQADKEERSIQIGRMSAIYKRAKQVAVWLGEADGISEIEITALSQGKFDVATRADALLAGEKLILKILDESLDSPRAGSGLNHHCVMWTLHRVIQVTLGHISPSP